MRDFLICAMIFFAVVGVGYLYLQEDRGGGTVEEIGSLDFAGRVLSNPKPVLVDFAADWCGPCRALEPTLERVATDLRGEAEVLRVDVDRSPDLAEKYQVRALPTMIVFRGGVEVRRIVGAASETQIKDVLR